MDKLLSLLAIFSPAGDESAAADWLAGEAGALPGVSLHRIGDNLIAMRGAPAVAIFAHTDTTGYTLGYRRQLIAIGAPAPRDRDALRSSDGLSGRIRLGTQGREGAQLRRVRNAAGEKVEPTPGSRWVYAREPRIKNGTITAPYLDNRAGVWAALETLRRCEHAAVAFSTGEERHGHGARVCGDWLHGQHGITQALISDVTWHTADTPCGKGPAVSLRDAFSPRQAFLDRVLKLASESSIAHQREIQSAGSSDGGHLLRSSTPIDWIFVGAPEKGPHTSGERAAVSDLEATADLLVYLTERLTEVR